MQATLVALYGYEKADEFMDLVYRCQHRVGTLLEGMFNSYPLEQVHATIIGLEATVSGAKILNRNFQDKDRPEDREMLLPEVINVRRSIPSFTIQLGAWQKNTPYGFKNGMKESPYEGSFFIRRNLVGAMGWPIETIGDDAAFPKTLFNLRNDFETKANALHRWHREPAFEDNDFFFRLGHTSLPDEHHLVEKARNEMREYLSDCQPLRLTITPSNLTAVAYVDNKLPWEQQHDNRRTVNAVTSEWLRAVYSR